MELFDFCVDSDTVVGSSLIILSDCCGEVPCFVRFSCILFHVDMFFMLFCEMLLSRKF